MQLRECLFLNNSTNLLNRMGPFRLIRDRYLAANYTAANKL